MDTTVPTVTESVEYVTQMTQLIELNGYIAGCCLFFVVVILCYFGYKFFRIFF